MLVKQLHVSQTRLREGTHRKEKLKNSEQTDNKQTGPQTEWSIM